MHEFRSTGLEAPRPYVELHRLAVRRPIWSRLMGLPTCRKHLKQDCLIAYSWWIHSELSATFGVEMLKAVQILHFCV